MTDVTLARIVEIADNLFPFHEAEPWDNSGLQVGELAAPVRAVAFSLDPTPATLGFAEDQGCDLLITHHPVFLDPPRRITTDHLIGRIAMQAVKAGIGILSLHTNLDAAPGGLNDRIVMDLGLDQCIVPEPARCARVAMLPQPVTFSRFAARVRDRLDLTCVRTVCDRDVAVHRVFVAAGSGMGFLQDARSWNADVMVTGDIRYHGAQEALEWGLPLVDAGHFGLEKRAVSLLATSFQARFARLGLSIRCVPCDAERDPFQLLFETRGGHTIERTTGTISEAPGD